MFRLLRSSAIAVLILGVLYLVFLRVEVRAWLLSPSVYPHGDWNNLAMMHGSDLSIPEPGGAHLDAWWVQAWQPQRTVLFFHSRSGNISNQSERVLRLRALGSNVLLADYRGYGKSSGQPSLSGIFADGNAVYRYAVDQLHQPPARLVLDGDELGSAVAAYLAARHPHVGGLVLESPFPSLRRWGNSILPLAGWFLPAHPSTLDDVRRYAGPKLILYGDRDHNLPASLSRAVYNAARAPKFEQVVAGGTQNHLVLDAGDQYVIWLRQFYQDANLTRPVKAAPPLMPTLKILRSHPSR